MTTYKKDLNKAIDVLTADFMLAMDTTINQYVASATLRGKYDSTDKGSDKEWATCQKELDKASVRTRRRVLRRLSKRFDIYV